MRIGTIRRTAAAVLKAVFFRAFLAANPQEVHAFHQAALAAGGRDDGEPGPRPHYGEQYYGCFVRDLDGHKIEAMAWMDPRQD